MTNEEAIKKLDGIKTYLLIHGWQDIEALDIAIRALEVKYNGCLACEYHNDCYDAFSHKSLNCPHYEEQENDK